MRGVCGKWQKAKGERRRMGGGVRLWDGGVPYGVFLFGVLVRWGSERC